jgi:DNA-binding NtrC family response regulator
MSSISSILWIKSLEPDPAENAILHALAHRLPTVCDSISEASQVIGAQSVDLLFANLPASDGAASDLFSRLGVSCIRVPIFARDPAAGIDDAMCMAKLGVEQLWGRDVEIEDVLHRIELCLADGRQNGVKHKQGPQVVSRRRFAWQRSLVGESRSMERVSQLIDLVAERRCTVLITGETGTGKEVVARAIHAASPRSAAPFVAVNCSALPENLLEAELFGHVKGAFTGAQQLRIGRFEQAHRGTLFLDEIGDMPLDLQAKILRVLQEREFERLGSSETISVDVRIVAATNADLQELVRKGRFREDLYYRLNVVPVQMPPLRARRGDVPLLVDYFLEKVCRHESIPLKLVADEAVTMLMARLWPGNVRQLENAVEMAVILSGRREVLETDDFPVSEPGAPSFAGGTGIAVPDGGLDFEETVSHFERTILSQALRKTRGNKKQAAEMLGLKRTTLSAKVRILEAAAGAPLI